jgi:hypothetical protein
MAGMNIDLLTPLFTAALIAAPLVATLVVLLVVGTRARRSEHRRREAQLDSVFNSRARRERGD